MLVYRAVDSRESGLVVFEVEQVTPSEHGIAPAPGATEIDTITAGGVSYTVFHEGSGPGGDGVELTGFSAIPDDPTDAFSYIYRIGTTVEAGDDIDPADLALRALRSQLDD